MKRKRLIRLSALVALAVLVFSPTVFAENGTDWLIIKDSKQVKEATETDTVIVTEESSVTIPFDELSVKEDAKGKNRIPFGELFVGQGTGTDNDVGVIVQTSSGGIPFVLADGEFISHYTGKYCKNGNVLAVIKQVLEANGLNLESAKDLNVGWSGVLPTALLKEEFRNPLKKLSEANDDAEKLAEQVGFLQGNVLVLKAELTTEQTEVEILSEQVASLKKQLVERTDALKASEDLLVDANKKTSYLNKLMASLKAQLTAARQETASASKGFDNANAEVAKLGGLLSTAKADIGNRDDILKKRNSSLYLSLAAGAIFLGLFLGTFFVTNKKIRGIRNGLDEADRRNSTLRELMKGDKVSFGINVEGRKREFVCYVYHADGFYDISPFEKKEKDGSATSAIQKKGIARDVIKGKVKQWLNNEKVPCVDAAIESGMLIEYPENVKLNVIAESDVLPENGLDGSKVLNLHRA